MIVAIAYCPKDYDQALRLASWLRELGPYPGHSLLTLRDTRCSEIDFKSAGFDSWDKLENVTIVDGWPMGANFIFASIARHIAIAKKEPWLFLEPDAVPLKKGWLDQLEAEYKARGKPFMGDFVNVKDVIPHMSGVAIYPPDLIEKGAGRALNSYDVAWDVVIADAVLPKFHDTKLIEHSWVHPTFKDWEQVTREVDLEHAVLYHSSKDGSLIDLLRKHNFPVPVLVEPNKVITPKRIGEARESTTEDTAAIIRPDSRGGGIIYDNQGIQKRMEVSQSRETANARSELSSQISRETTGATQSSSCNTGGKIDEATMREMRQPEGPSSPQQLQVTDGSNMALPSVPHDDSSLICDILIKSYPKDYEWLSYCLTGLEKFATGFRQIIVVYPSGVDFPLPDFGPRSIPIMGWPVVENGEPYLFQQSVKFSAHQWTDAPYILHIDSDTVPCAPFTPQTFMRNGKCLWLMTPYSAISTPWQQPTERFMGAQVEYEFMRRFPILLPRSLHIAAARYVEIKFGKSATEFIVSQPGRDFSEFNALGALAYYRDGEDFEWLDTTKEDLPPLVAIQSWSHGGLTEEVKEKFETILAGDGNSTTQAAATPLPAPSQPMSSGLNEQNEDGSDGSVVSPTSPAPTHDFGGTYAAWERIIDGQHDPEWLMSELAKNFTSPLAKGRIFKKLKKYPVIKS